MSTLATRYAVVYNLCRQPCSRMANIGIATYNRPPSLAIVSHTMPNVGGTPLRVLALYIANRVHVHCLGKIGTANHAHVVGIMHTPRKTPPPNPQKKGVKLKLPAFGNTIHLSNTRNTHRRARYTLSTVATVPHVAVFRRIHSMHPPNRFRLGYAAPRCLTATASSAGCSQPVASGAG